MWCSDVWIGYARDIFVFETKAEMKQKRKSFDHLMTNDIGTKLPHEVDIFYDYVTSFSIAFLHHCLFLNIFFTFFFPDFLLVYRGFIQPFIEIAFHSLLSQHKFWPNKVAIECVDRKANNCRKKIEHTTARTKQNAAQNIESESTWICFQSMQSPKCIEKKNKIGKTYSEF